MNDTLCIYKGVKVDGMYRDIKTGLIFVKVNDIKDDIVHFSYIRYPGMKMTTRKLDYFRNNYKLVE